MDQVARGLPPGKLKGLHLSYDAPSSSLILVATYLKDGDWLTDVFVRRAQEERYVSLLSICCSRSDVPTGATVTSWTLAPSSHVLFTVSRVGMPLRVATAGSRGAKALWPEGMARVDLKAREAARWQFDRDDLILHSLVGAESEDVFFAVVGITAQGGSAVDYSLAQLRWGDEAISCLHDMPDIFL